MRTCNPHHAKKYLERDNSTHVGPTVVRRSLRRCLPHIATCRFGYDYFENLLGLAAKDPFVVSTPHPNIASGEDGQEEAADGDLSIITLGVNQVPKGYH